MGGIKKTQIYACLLNQTSSPSTASTTFYKTPLRQQSALLCTSSVCSMLLMPRSYGTGRESSVQEHEAILQACLSSRYTTLWFPCKHLSRVLTENWCGIRNLYQSYSKRCDHSNKHHKVSTVQEPEHPGRCCGGRGGWKETLCVLSSRRLSAGSALLSERAPRVQGAVPMSLEPLPLRCQVFLFLQTQVTARGQSINHRNSLSGRRNHTLRGD